MDNVMKRLVFKITDTAGSAYSAIAEEDFTLFVNETGRVVESKQYAQNNITFTNPIGDFFGTSTGPRTGLLTIDTMGAVLGGNACVFYNNPTLSITPTPGLIIGEFVPDELNVIFFLRTGGGFIIANIINEGVPTIPAPPTALTLTQGEIDPETLPAEPTDLSLLQGTF